MDCFNEIFKSSIAQFCPNLKKILALFSHDELSILKNIFINYSSDGTKSTRRRPSSDWKIIRIIAF
jgi:hypothetical protein